MGHDRDGISRLDYQFDEASINALLEHKNQFCSSIDDYPFGKYNGKGIVYTAGGVNYVTCVLISIQIIRELGCILPIEVWYVGNEIPDYIAIQFEGLGVVLKNFLDYEDIKGTGYYLKPLSIMYSEFEEILFIDSDNVPYRDPTFLFDSEEYQTYGAVFWPDFWKTDPENPIWEIVEQSNKSNDREQESGQILINKKECWKELNLCVYFNRYSEYYYKMLHGDKDTFRFAWIALEKKYFIIPYIPGSLGILKDGTFFGNTMVQYDFKGEILFLHRNLMKWGITMLGERFWEVCKRVKLGATNYQIEHKLMGMRTMIDLFGEVEFVPLPNKVKEIETRCLEYLAMWRNTEAYRAYLEHMYFIGARFGIIHQE